MRMLLGKPAPVWLALAGAALIWPVLLGTPAYGQYARITPVPDPSSVIQAQAPEEPGSLPTQPPATPEQTAREAAQPPQQLADQSLPPERGAGVGGDLLAQNMIGDFIGPSKTVVLHMPNGATVTARIPLEARGAFRISENESPRPQDRVFFNYNYFNRADDSLHAEGFPRVDVHRETMGFEKTFLDRNASIGLRLPFFETEGDGSIKRSDIGDLSIVLKYALINDRETGDVLSGGIVITAPTGANEAIFDDTTIHSTLLQPWAGYILNFDRLYVQGFASVVVPTDSRDVTLMFSDIGAGYWAYRNQEDEFLRGIVPTFEAHVTTPLNHRDSSNTIFVPDIVDFTSGTHFVFNGGSSLLIGACVPVTGPKPFDFEAIVQFNYRF